MSELTDDEDGADIRVFDEQRSDLVNVSLVLLLAAVVDCILAVGRGSSAITVREVIDDKLSRVIASGRIGRSDVCQSVRDRINLGKGVTRKKIVSVNNNDHKKAIQLDSHPLERWHLRDLGRSRSQGPGKLRHGQAVDF